MNCYYHPDRRSEKQCSICGNNLCAECSALNKNGAPLCSRCIAMEAAEDAAREIDYRVAERDRQTEQKAARKGISRKIITLAQYVLIIVGLVIIAFNTPKILRVFEDEKPLRQGDYETDAVTDQCIRNLWEISKLLQEGKLPKDDILCPASKKPYEIIETASDVIVRSPDPGLYGFRDIRVSKSRPVPELIK